MLRVPGASSTTRESSRSESTSCCCCCLSHPHDLFALRLHCRRPTLENPPPFPTHFAGEDESQELDVFLDKIHRPSDPTIVFQEDESTKKVQRTGAKLAKVRVKK